MGLNISNIYIYIISEAWLIANSSHSTGAIDSKKVFRARARSSAPMGR